MVRLGVLAAVAAAAVAKPLKVIINPEHPHKKLGVELGQVSAHGPAPGPAAAPAPAPLGLCDCPTVPGDQCTCGGSLDFLKCVHTKCSAGECDCPKDVFESECSALAGSCSDELEFNGCDSLHTSCQGLYSQAADGVIGLTLDTTHLWEEAFCGPHGRCTGKIHVQANVYRPETGAWLECVVPTGEGNKTFHCSKEVSDDGAAMCKLKIPSNIAPDDAVKGHCYLTDGKHGTKLTKDAFFIVRNRYDGPDAAAAVAAVAPKAVSTEKETVVLDRADEKDQHAEVKREVVEEEAGEEATDNGYWFKKHEAVKVKGGVGAKTAEPHGYNATWIPLACIFAILVACAALLVSKPDNDGI